MAQTRLKTRSQSDIEALLQKLAHALRDERVERTLKALEALQRLELSRRENLRCLSLQAECYVVSRQFAALDETIGRIRGLAESHDDISEADLMAAHGAMLAGRAREALRMLVPIVRDFGQYDGRRARAMRIVGIACYRTGHYGWARAFLQVATAFYHLNGLSRDLIHCLNSLSLVSRSEGDVDLALLYLRDAARLLPKRGMTRTRMRLMVNHGVCLLKTGKLVEARTLFLGARAMASERSDPVYVAAICNNLGHVYRIEGNYSVAAEFHAQALALAKSGGSDRQVCLALEFLGENCTEEGKAAQALVLLNEAYDSARKISKHGDVMMEILRRRGEVHAMRNDMGAAVLDLRRAIELCGSRGEKREAALARRAYWLVASPDVEELAIRMREVLLDLDQLADRFEYARTVYLILKDARLDAEKLPWLADAVVAATHYFTVLGSKVWKARLQEVSGHQRRINRLRAEQDPLKRYPLASRSPAFGATMDAARVAARSRFPALIVGETGVGKEIVAQLLHQTSERAGFPLIAINCGALPEALVESELFGYAAGAFTGATREKPGLFEAAHKGTVLMDEIGDLPLMAQVKVLRFLDTGEVRRVGEVRSRRCDVRVIASTNRDLETLVQEGRFRSDLLFRLQAFRIRVPSLRERPEDVLDLARVFLREAAEGGDVPSLSPDLEGWMLGYEWPGNVRELRNLCGYMHAQAWGRAEILMSDLPPEYRSRDSGTRMSPFDRDLVEFERTRIAKALKESRGSISGAAKLLGMSRNTVSQRMRKFGLAREAFEI